MHPTLLVTFLLSDHLGLYVFCLRVHAGVRANGFIAHDLAIENIAGPKLKDGQAVALLIKVERSMVYCCALRSY
jgi:pectinesterase